MAGNVQELLEYSLIEIAGIKKEKSRLISSRFADIETFNNFPIEKFDEFKFADGSKAIILNTREQEQIITLQKSSILAPKISPQENFTKLIARKFLDTQVKNITKLSILDLNCNPLLIASLKLNTPEELFKYYVYQSASRSIVTSFGFFVQKLLLYSSENIQDASDQPTDHGTKWDLVKTIDNVKHWIEAKSGPNDLNKTQVLSYCKAIENAEKNNDKAYIGETYGKRTMQTITHTHYKKYLPNWEKRTLIGRELWDFTSGDKDYHSKLLNMLNEVSNSILDNQSVIITIEKKTKELINCFNKDYTSIEEFTNDLW